MPPKKKGRKVKLPKIGQQKINITKRLMDITLKVDHYIYKNKPISSAAATLYLQEVTSYQAVCIHDARPLQVIEKLSRFMQAIIEEQSRNCDTINYDYGPSSPHVDNREASPVYSLTEEDKLEMQIISGVTVTNNRSHCFNKDNATFKCEKENEQSTNLSTCKDGALFFVNSHERNNQIICSDTIDLCSNDGQIDIETINNSDKETLINSDVTFNENFYTNLDVESGLCSQSILKTWVVPEADKSQILQVEQYGQDMVEVDKAIKSLMNHIPTVSNINENNSPCNENYKNKTNVKSNSAVGILKNTKEFSGTKERNQVKIPAKKTRKRAFKNAETNKGGNSKTKSKPNNAVNKENFKEVKYPADIVLSKVTKTIKSCNLVEANLSWIENIKYVRQINQDENDTSLKTLCDSFWENCDLPPGWDDTDFNY